MEFGRKFEEDFLSQRKDENRSIEESLNLAWKLLSILPIEELDRVDPKIAEKYYGR